MNAQHSASINAEQNFTRFREFAGVPKHDFAKGLNGKGCKQQEWLIKGKSPISKGLQRKGWHPARSLSKKREDR